MNKNQFYKYISDYNTLSEKSLEDVLSLVEDYPYFQSAWSLYLKILYDLGDVSFENSLKTYSVYISDRKVLSKIIKDNYPFSEIKKDEFSEEQEKTDYISLINNSLEIKPVENNENFTESVTDAAPSLADIILENIRRAKEHNEDNDKIFQDISQFVNNKNERKEEEIIVEKTEKNELSLSEFILTEINSIKNTENNITREIQLKNLKTTTKKEEISDKSEKEKLIEMFIYSEPKIIPDKNFTPQNSFQANDFQNSNELFSEKLAQIYAKQNCIDKAIEIYQKLNLKFPEKSIYFASQIEKLKKQKKNI